MGGAIYKGSEPDNDQSNAVRQRLNSVGKVCFIRDWDLWELEKVEIVEALQQRYGSIESESLWKADCAQWLLRDQERLETALEMVIEEQRVDGWVRERARLLLKGE